MEPGSTEFILVSALVVVVLAPVILWIRRKMGVGKVKVELVVTCPYCDSENGLDRLRNYVCAYCSRTVAFYNLDTGEPYSEAEVFNCAECGSENFRGVKFCMECGSLL